nr:hypothetical protein [candidate division Zixibacteria bacterium]
MNSFKFIVMAVVLLLALPVLSLADSKDEFTMYYSPTNPGDTELTDPLWTEYTGQLITVDADDSIWIGVDNIHIVNQIKRLELTLTGTNLADLTQEKVMGYLTGGDTTRAWLVTSVAIGANSIKYVFGFDPQPDWEVIKFVNEGTGEVQISEMVMYSTCRQVPTLTQWGIAVLVVMLILATYIVYRRKTAIV